MQNTTNQPTQNTLQSGANTPPLQVNAGMTTLEIVTISLLVLGCLAAYIQSAMAIKGNREALKQHQIALASYSSTLKQHMDDHDWGRRKAAEDACIHFNAGTNITVKLEQYLNWRTLDKPQTIGMFRQALLKADGKTPDPATDYETCDEIDCGQEASDLIQSVHRLLNYYESFARGIEEGVFDERIIRRAFYGQMKSAFHLLKPYIDHRRTARNGTNSLAWVDLQALLENWGKSNDLPKREKTGS